MTPDPWKFFYSRRALGVRQSDLYSELIPDAPLETRQVGPGSGPLGEGGSVGEGDRDDREARLVTAIRARRVEPVALWLGTFRTDGDGVLAREFDLPPLSGRLRVMAVAHDGKYFGHASEPITVRDSTGR